MQPFEKAWRRAKQQRALTRKQILILQGWARITTWQTRYYLFRALCCARAAVRAALNSVLNTRSCSSCSGWPSESCWQASRLSLERRPHPCSRCRARPAAAVAVCVSALISGVAAGSTCKARHKALSRLADAGVKRMAAHDGRDVHVSAQPAVQTPIDSDA